MPGQLPSKTPWNLFARELESVLANYNLSLNQLEGRTGISRGKVQRLLESLQKPDLFPILNVSEMELVRKGVGLNVWDLLHLRAALLATSIEKTLMASMPSDEALLVTEQVFPIILIALQKQSSRPRGSGATRSGDDGPVQDDEIVVFFDTVWKIIDEADLALQLSSNVLNTPPSCIEYARSALAHFTDVHTRLVASARHMQNFQLWHDCETACQQGLVAANRRLEELGR